MRELTLSSTGERWRPVPGHDGYLASDQGRVYSLSRWIHRSRGIPFWKKGRLLKQSLGPPHCPYLNVGSRRSVHRLVLLAFVGVPPKGWWCDHLNGDKTDNRLCNLEWVTAAENNRRARAKLTKDDVRMIRRSTKKGTELAALLGVSTSHISGIRHNRKWRDVV